MPDGIGQGVSRRRELRRKQRHARSSIVGVALAIVVLAAFVGAILAAVVGASTYIDNARTKASLLERRELKENSVIYASDGVRLTTIASEENRQVRPLAQISPWLQKATVAIEDRRFYEHEGVDWQGIGRAAIKDLQAGKFVEGASTITQQLVRGLFLTQEQSIDRKLQEALLALDYEKTHTKAQILEQYLNTVPYGQTAYGAEAAAFTYFKAHAKNLTLAQAALLAGLPQAPSRFNPFVNPDSARARRDEVLRAMLDQGMITRIEYASAVAATIELERGFYGQARQPYFANYVRNVLEADSAFGGAAVRGGGLLVRTTIDRRLQNLAFAAMRSILPKPPCPKAPKPSCDPAAAIVSIDPKTGDILAMASTSSYRQTQFNFAQGKRQPGSTFKPFTLATAIEEGIDPSTVRYLSAPFTLAKDEQFGPWEVHTAGGNYLGPVTIERGTIASDNTVYAQLALDVGPENIVEMARRLGVNQSTLNPFPALTLGADAVTPLEMASAYATFASQGVYHKPRAIREVGFSGSDRVVKFSPRGKRVLSDGVAAEVTRILGENMRQGTGVNARTSDDRPQAGKTGTTDNHRDAWFCGFTPDLSTCVWIGYPISEEYELLNVEGQGVVSGPNLPAEIWHAYMDRALAGVKPHDFPNPRHPAEFVDFASKYTERAVVIIPPETTTDKGTPAPTPIPPPATTG